MPHPPLSLLLLRAPDTCHLQAGQRWTLDAPTLRLGRLPSCDLCLHDPSVSREHALLTRDPDGAWSLQNLSAKSALFVAGERIAHKQRCPLELPATIQLGALVLRLEIGALTEPFDHPLSIPAHTAPASDDEPLLRVERDGDDASVWLLGKLIAVKPTSAVLLHTLARSPGHVIHAWDLIDALGKPCDLPQAISAIRRPLRALIERGELPADQLRALIAQSLGDSIPQDASPDQLVRLLISSRRQRGYALMLPAHVVRATLAG